MVRIALTLVCVVILSACATSSNKISAQYVSPMQYRDYDCNQLAEEMSRVSRRVGELRGSIDEEANEDKVAMGVGLVLFWPALLFIDGDSPEGVEYARLKGEFEALQVNSAEKKCEIRVENN